MPVGRWRGRMACAAGDPQFPFGQDAHYADTPAAFALTATDGNATATETTSELIFENDVGTAGVVDQPAEPALRRRRDRWMTFPGRRPWRIAKI